VPDQADQTRRRRRGPLAIAGGLTAGLLISGFTVWSASQAAFSGTTANTPNVWNAATIALTDNDNSTAMFTAGSYLLPGSGNAVTKCIDVKYTGTVAAGTSVKLYGDPTKVSGTDLSQYVDLKIEIGTNSSPNALGDFTCANFTTGTTIWSGGAGKTLYDFQTTATSASPLNTTWQPTATNEQRAFRFTTYVVDDNTANGRTAGNIPFTWSVTS
jgi:hypothetical protein